MLLPSARQGGCSLFLCFLTSDDTGITPEKIVDIRKINVCYILYKLSNSRYGEDSNVGKLMYDAQQRDFENGGNDTMIGDGAARMLIGSSDANYPILGKDMTTDDLLGLNL